MKLAVTAFLGFFAFAAAARADDAALCQSHDGTYLTGTVTQAPNFKPGHPLPLDRVELSHTHLTLLADQDGQSYDVAIDNVFASGYDAAGETIPAPLTAIVTGAKLELCGKLYATGGPGIDWVHTNCGGTPTLDKPDGWVKIIGADGIAGPNLEDAQAYCPLWQ